MDDNFASIVAAIEEGRTLFDNLKKSIAYTLTHLWPELLPVFLNLAFGFPLGLPGLIILTIDLLSEQGPAISFVYEKPEDAVMKRPPRSLQKDRLISRGVILYSYLVAGTTEMLVSMFAYFMVYVINGIPVSSLAFAGDVYFQLGGNELASNDFVANGQSFSPAQQTAIYYESISAWYATLVMCQFWNVWVCKTRSASIFTHGIFDNPVTIGGVALELAILFVVVFIPGLQTIFYTANLAGVIWPISLVFLAVMLPYTEISKYYFRKYPDSKFTKIFMW
jgi:sodium/potassium-transporting ATPase subunit alpha